MEHDRHNFLSFWTVFCPFTHPKDLENQNFEKIKNTTEDIIILPMCTINKNHMMYGSSDMECNRQNIFVILDRFLSFYPPNNPKNKNLEKRKKPPGDIIILDRCNINENSYNM